MICVHCILIVKTLKNRTTLVLFSSSSGQDSESAWGLSSGFRMARIMVSARLPSLLEALGASPHPAPQAAGRIQFHDLQVEASVSCWLSPGVILAHRRATPHALGHGPFLQL